MKLYITDGMGIKVVGVRYESENLQLITNELKKVRRVGKHNTRLKTYNL